MGHSTEPKMDELKRLLRRLDGLDASKSAVKTAQESASDNRGYVGALRGTPELPDSDVKAAPAAGTPRAATPAALWAAAAVALISTVAAYLVVSQDGAGNRETKARATGVDQRGSTGTDQKLIRSAEQLLEAGDIEAARALLQKAAELGSGDAALKLGRSYDPAQAARPSFADSQSNSALARAWYERALALGTQEAAAYIRPQSSK
jgi:TPR repeat protein